MERPRWHIRPAQTRDRDFMLGLTPRLAQGFPLPARWPPRSTIRSQG
jgi:hypothetical protein